MPIKYEWQVQGNYGQGFELVWIAADRKDGLEVLREYRENQCNTLFRLVKTVSPGYQS